MNIDLTIVSNDQILTITLDKPTTSHYLISLLKKRKELHLLGDYFLADFYTMNTIDVINESGKMVLLQEYHYDKAKEKKSKTVPIEELIMKVTKGKKMLKRNEEDYYSTRMTYGKKCNEDNNTVIDIIIDKDCFDQMIQQYNDLDISPDTNDVNFPKENSGSIMESDYISGENTSQDEIIQNSISNYVYSMMIANNKIVSDRVI